MFETDASFRGLIGVGRCEMTPEPGIYSNNWGSARYETADAIHRPLYATALCFRAGPDELPCVLATIDYCWFPSYQVLESLQRPILERLGLERERFLLVLSHSHAVPHIDADLEHKPGGDKIPAFRAKVVHALSESIQMAVKQARPAILSWGQGHSTLARTRDFRDPASGRILCGPNPDGNADTTVLVGRIVDEESREILGTLVNYACHPVSLGGGNRSVSPDYIGSMREIVEMHTGRAPCLFLHGPSGNQTPRDSYSDYPAVADRNGEILGFAALSVLRALLPPGERLEFSRVEASGANLAIWETRPFVVDTTLRATVSYLQLPARARPSVEEINKALQDTTDAVNRARLTRSKQYLMNLEAGLGAGFPLWGVRLGQAVIIATPAEPFTDLQIELRKLFPKLAIIVMNDTNGSFNYLPPASYFGNGAYEQDCSDYGPGALELVIAAAANTIRALMDAPNPGT